MLFFINIGTILTVQQVSDQREAVKGLDYFLSLQCTLTGREGTVLSCPLSTDGSIRWAGMPEEGGGGGQGSYV